MPYVLAALCAVLSGTFFYFSTNLGAMWPLAWIAPIPVLWLAFRPGNTWLAFAAATLAGMLGALNLLTAYAGLLPASTLAVGIVLEGVGLGACVIGARLVAQRFSPLAGALAFAALWTTIDFIASYGANGTAASPAYSQVGMPILIQGASLFGLWIVTFLLGLVSGGLAAALATRRWQPAAVAVALLALNVGFGAWRMTTAPKMPVVRVGLAADGTLVDTGTKNDEKSALKVADSYAAVARDFEGQNVALAVFPEKIMVASPQWNGAIDADFETAAHIAHETIVFGVDERGPQRLNAARIYFANGAPPMSYVKRHLVPGLEDAFVPGQGQFMLGNRIGIAICKDMDFQKTLLADSLMGPTMYAVPAWDFRKDGWWHARLAIMRGVEDGFSVARAANDGLLTLTDAYGRILGEKRTEPDGLVTLVGDLPRGPGHTLYGRIGDLFAWFCAGLSLGLVGFALIRTRQ